MTSLPNIKKRISDAYQDLIERDGRPEIVEIRAKINEKRLTDMISVIYFHSIKGKPVIFISTGKIGQKHASSLVFVRFPSGFVRRIPIKDIIDIIDPIFDLDENWPFPRRFFFEPKE